MTLDHISYSQYNTYLSCPRQWYLSKVVQAEETQTWYLPIGTAVHSMIEWWLEATTSQGGTPANPPSAEAFFYPLIRKQMQVEPDLSKWVAGGSPQAPVSEEAALQRVKDCFERALELLDQIDVWEVEYDASGHLPGLEVPVKAFVDIIGEHKKFGPVIGDWKTGSSKPKDAFQLETYAALLRQQNWARLANPVGSSPAEALNWTGLWLMLKPGASVARPIGLSAVSPTEVGAKYQEVYEKMKATLYPTYANYFKCKYCFHQDNCLVGAGPTDRAKYYDRSYEDGYPF